MNDAEKKEINEMDSEEFIAHLFYNVLGGVYAASEEEARQGILDMLDCCEQSPAPSESLSNCCNAPFQVDTADEGTSCYVCDKCKRACDPRAESLTAELVRVIEDAVGWLETVKNDSNCRYTRAGADSQLIQFRAALSRAKNGKPA